MAGGHIQERAVLVISKVDDAIGVSCPLGGHAHQPCSSLWILGVQQGGIGRQAGEAL